eukprot:2109759-Prymnesium_polylepis.1
MLHTDGLTRLDAIRTRTLALHAFRHRPHTAGGPRALASSGGTRETLSSRSESDGRPRPQSGVSTSRWLPPATALQLPQPTSTPTDGSRRADEPPAPPDKEADDETTQAEHLGIDLALLPTALPPPSAVGHDVPSGDTDATEVCCVPPRRAFTPTASSDTAVVAVRTDAGSPASSCVGAHKSGDEAQSPPPTATPEREASRDSSPQTRSQHPPSEPSRAGRDSTSPAPPGCSRDSSPRAHGSAGADDRSHSPPPEAACRRRSSARRGSFSCKPRPAYKARFARQKWALLRKRLPEILEASRHEWRQTSWLKALAGWQERSAREALRGLPLLHRVSEKTLDALMQYTSVSTMARYSELYAKGRPMTCCYVMMQGCVSVSLRHGAQARSMLPGAVLAGGAWLDGTQHISGARAEQPSVLLIIRAAEAKLDPRLLQVADDFRKVEGDAWKVELLRDFVPLFSDLPIGRLRALAPIFHVMTVTKGDLIIAQGDQGNRVFVLVTGEVLAYRMTPSGGELKLKTINERSDFTYFGEVALFQKVLRTANVRANDSGVILY